MKKNILIIFLLILSLAIFVFIKNDYFLYKKTIVRIDKIEEIKNDEVENTLGFKEKYYLQKITGTIMNTKNKNKKISFENEYASSLVVTEKYNVGDEVFVKDKQVEGLKRDKYVVLIALIFLVAITLVGKLKGLLSIISVITNTIVFYISLNLYFKGLNLLVLCLLESIFFTIFSLTLSNGYNKKTKSAIISVFIALTILLLLSLIVIKSTNYKGISFNEISFLTVPVTDVFIAELLIGGLGAIMDVCITVSASVDELVNKDSKITKKALIKSGTEIGKDIMGTMINVLFFTYLCSGLPIFVLALRNGFTLYNYISSNFSLEISRFLIGSIGIVISIPISIFITIFFYKRGDLNE